MERDVLAHRLAEEVVRRMRAGASLGSPSLYNVTREVLIERLPEAFDCTCSPRRHLVTCPLRWPATADEPTSR